MGQWGSKARATFVADIFNATLSTRILMKNLCTLGLVIWSLFKLPGTLASQNLVLDPAFGDNGLWYSQHYWSRAALLPDNSLLFCGSVLAMPPSKSDGIVGRVLPSGVLDLAFGNNGIAQVSFDDMFNGNYPYEGLSSVISLPDGRIVAVGGKASYITEQPDKAVMAVLKPNGQVDGSFGNMGRRLFEFNGYTVTHVGLLQFSDGDPLLWCVLAKEDEPIEKTHMVFFRFNPDMSPDTSFGPNGDGTAFQLLGPASPFNGTVGTFRVGISKTDKIVMCGPTNSTAISVTRYNSDGSEDLSFGTNGQRVIEAAFDIQTFDIDFQPDGKMLALGSLRVAGDPVFTILRLNDDGTKDISWGEEGIAVHDLGFYESVINDGVSQTDGRVLVVGSRLREDGIYEAIIVRCLPNGTLDSTFGDGGVQVFDLPNVQEVCNGLFIAPDHAVYISGSISSNGQGARFLAKFLPEEYVGTKNLDSQTDLKAKLYPSIASSGQWISLQYALAKKSLVSAQLVDAKAAVAQTFFFSENQSAGEHSMELKLRDELPAGLYRLILKTEQRQTALPVLLKR